MASFSAIPLSYPPPLKDFIHWDPTALEPKAKSKAKAKEKPKTTERSLNEYGYEGDWADIDDFPTNMSGPNRGPLATAGAARPSGSRHLDSEGDFNTVLPPQIPQSQQAVGVEDMRLVGDGDFDGISPEFPILLDNDAVSECDSIADTQSTDGLRDDLDADLDAACMSSFSVENVGGVYNNDAPEQDELYVDVGMGTQPLATRKRTYASSAEVLDSEDSRSAKRRSARPQSDIIAPSPMCTPTTTPTTTPPPPPPQACGSHLSPLGVRNDPNAGNVDCGGKDNSVETSDLPRSSRVDSPNGGDGQESEAVIDAKSLHSPIQSSSPAGQRGGDQGFSPDSGTGENESDNSDSEPEESNKDNRWRGPPRTGPRPQGRRMPTATSRQLRSAPPRYPSSRKAGITTRSGSPRGSSPVKAGYGSSIDFGPSHNTADQLPDITLCHAPKRSLIVTAIVRCNMMSTSSPNLSALKRKFLGNKGQVIRETQVSPDSWLLVGYRDNDNSPPNQHTSQSLTHRKAGRKSSFHNTAANCDATNLDNNGDGEEKNEAKAKDTSNDNPYATSGKKRRTHVPWSKSDEQKLLAYRNMGMEWREIFDDFPTRTPGAVRTRCNMLQGK